MPEQDEVFQQPQCPGFLGIAAIKQISNNNFNDILTTHAHTCIKIMVGTTRHNKPRGIRIISVWLITYQQELIAIGAIGGANAGLCAIIATLHLFFKKPDNKKEVEIIEKLVDKIPTNASGPIPANELDRIDKGLKEHIPKIDNLQDLGGETLIRIGNIEYQKSNYFKALMLYEDAYSLGQRNNEKQLLSAALGNIGLIYKDKGEPDKALDYHRQALAIHKEIGHKLGQANQLGNIGLIYKDKGDRERARTNLAQAHDIFKKCGYAGDGPDIVRRALEELDSENSN